VKVKRSKFTQKACDLNGKPLKFQWKVIVGVRGVGKRDSRGKASTRWVEREECQSLSKSELRQDETRAKKTVPSRMEKRFKEWEKEEARESREEEKLKRERKGKKKGYGEED